MSTIVTRQGKGSELTHSDMDNNFTNLNTDKIESVSLSDLSITSDAAEINSLNMTTSASDSGYLLKSNGQNTAPTWQVPYYTGMPCKMDYVQTRSNSEYVNESDIGSLVNISDLEITVTPIKSGNKMVLEWVVNGEASNHNLVFVIRRNGVSLPDAEGDDIWEGTANAMYDGGSASTPANMVIKIVDENTLSTETTYGLYFKPSSSSNITFKLNRAYSGATGGQSSYEHTLSVVTATEIYT